MTTLNQLASPRVPDRPGLEGLEERRADEWDRAQTYRFNPSSTRSDIYAIDTPPRQ